MSTRSLPIEHVVITEGYRGGEPYLAGKGVTVREVAVAHTQVGAGIDEIATAYNLTPAQVHAALAYYYDHRMELEPLVDPNARIALPENPLREMTASEVSLRYGISPQAVRQAAGTGQIPARKSGATWLIKRRDAEAKWGKPR
jgi:uncharacterized protein (DUF433 family)